MKSLKLNLRAGILISPFVFPAFALATPTPTVTPSPTSIPSMVSSSLYPKMIPPGGSVAVTLKGCGFLVQDDMGVSLTLASDDPGSQVNRGSVSCPGIEIVKIQQYETDLKIKIPRDIESKLYSVTPKLLLGINLGKNQSPLPKMPLEISSANVAFAYSIVVTCVVSLAVFPLFSFLSGRKEALSPNKKIKWFAVLLEEKGYS